MTIFGIKRAKENRHIEEVVFRYLSCAGALAASSLAMLARASDLSPPDWPVGPTAVMEKLEYVLPGDSQLTYDTISFRDGAVIRASGHNLKIEIRKSMRIEGTLLIEAFDPSQVPPAPPAPAARGRGSPHYHRGPDVEGDAATERDGADGGPGEHGLRGSPGRAGYAAGHLTIQFAPGASISGKLVIRNEGGRGSIGGPGGQGGQGGDGQQGGRCMAYNPRSEPGRGGRGGPGGPGGLGGPGGDGGNGGDVIIITGSQAVRDYFDAASISVAGGTPGLPGQGGPGGPPGEPGYGGRGAQLCAGQVGEKVGPAGTPGPNETEGEPGAAIGHDGYIQIL